MDKQLRDALSEQINCELHSAYVYLSMVAYFEEQGLSGFAHWMRLQSREEIEHAMKIFDFLHDRGERVALGAITKPPVRFKSALDAFQKAYQHEQKVTDLIHKLYAKAVKANDYPTQVMLHWFIDEQVEEEKSASEVVQKLEMIGEHKPPLLMLDHALGKREE